MATIREKIINALLAHEGIDQKGLDAVMIFQKERSLPFGEALVAKGLINEQDLLLLLVRELQIPSVDLRRFKLDERLKEEVPERLARQYNLIPVATMGTSITVALADPLNLFAVDDLRNITGKKIDVVMGTPSQIKEAIDRFYGGAGQGTVSELSKNIDVGDFEIITDLKGDDGADVDGSEQAPVIRIVNLVIKEALRQRASDIHLEPTEENMRVRYRIDGVLTDIMEIPRESQSAVMVRLKIMARMDITVNQVPQDGRFKMRLASKEVDFRVSILPTCNGGKVVMRILDKANLAVGLQQLGISDHSFEALSAAIVKPFGMVLITGPTGSGKSTTLYSIISQLNSVDKNIITVEDPVEYLVEGLTQIEVKADIGLSFASVLRSILRQSPDIVMVGEIRDNETADIAIKASLTGQMVFSTLHTNDATGALTRLVDMGVEPFLVASSLVLVCAQRLCRRLCPHCKHEVEIAQDVLRHFAGRFDAKTKFYAGRGCDRCRNTGYLGRFCITEVLVVDDAVRELLLKGGSSDEIRDHVRKFSGFRTLWDDVLERLVQGQTTVEEVLRVASRD